MAGFSNDTMYADNVNFSGSKTPTVTTNGQLLIGSTVAPNIRVGNITSTDSSVTVTNGSGSINLAVSNPILFTSITLTSPQVLSLDTVPVLIVPPQGADVVIVPISVYAQLNFNTTQYTSAAFLTILRDNNENNRINFFSDSFISASSTTFSMNGFWGNSPFQDSPSTFKNTGLYAGAFDDTITGGDSTITIGIHYTLVTVS